MNITEANNVNTVLRWALSGPAEQAASDHGARDSAAALAGRAAKALLAGLTSEQVLTQWDRHRPIPVAAADLADAVQAAGQRLPESTRQRLLNALNAAGSPQVTA